MLTGRYLCLRKPEEGDIWVMSRWLRDTDFLLNISGLPAPLQCDAAFLDAARRMLVENAKDMTTRVTFVAETTQSVPVGLVMFNSLNWKHRAVEMHLGIGEAAYRGKVYGGELYLLGLLHLFFGLNLRVVLGYVYEGNEHALQLNRYVAKCAGVLRQHIFRNGAYRDMLVFTLTRADFFQFLATHREGLLKKYYQYGFIPSIIESSC